MKAILNKLNRPPKALTAAALACLLAGCNGCNKDAADASPAVTVQAATAQKGEISRVVTTEAVIFPFAQEVITPKINAPVKKFLVNRGQKVKQGQLLAVLENRDLAAQSMDSKGALEQADATYKTNVNATLPEEFQKAQLDVETTKQEMEQQQQLYTSRQDLFNQGALPRKDLEQAKVALTQATSQYNEAKKHLDGLNAGGKDQALKAQAGQLNSAKGKAMLADANLGYSEIRSGINGVVTDRPLYPGEMASTTTPLLTVMDLSQITAKAHVTQNDAMLLRKGDKATITLAGLEDKIPGTVTLVSPALDPNSTTVEIWVQAANATQQLRPGMTVQLSITAQTVHDALVIPASALLNASGDGAQVMVVDSQSVAQSRDVKTGVRTGQDVQIVSGLKEGEQVVTEGAFGLNDKTKVKIEKASAAEGEGDAGKDDKAKD